MIAGMRAQSVMHQEFVARIEEAEELAARCMNEKDRVGWLKVADNYRKQLDRLEPPAEQAEDTKPAPAPSRSRHAA
jgi:hypothetical protein